MARGLIEFEDAIPRLLGIPANLLRFIGLMDHMGVYKELPSRCDLERWSLLPEAAGEKQEGYFAHAKYLRGLNTKPSRKGQANDSVENLARPRKRRKRAPGWS